MGGQDVLVFELRLQGEAGDAGVAIWVSDRTRLLVPLPKPVKQKKSEEADVEDNDDDDAAEIDSDEEEMVAAVDIDSDVASSHISDDSRVEHLDVLVHLALVIYYCLMFLN